MPAMNPVELRIIIDAQNKASATLNKAQKQVKDLQKQTEKIGGSTSAVVGMGGGFKGMGKSVMTAGMAIGALGSKMTALAGKYWMFAAGAAAVTAMSKAGALLEARMGALGGSFEKTSERIRKLSDASGGAFSMPEIVDAENKIKAFNIGLKLTPAVLSNIQGRAAMMGITTTKALDDVILGISRGSRKILDNIGIIVSNSEANKIWAEKLGKSVHKLTDAERRAGFLSLAMRELNKSTLQVTTSYGASLKASAHLKDGNAALQLSMASLMQIAEPIAEAFMAVARTIAAVLDPVLTAFVKVVAPYLKMISTLLLKMANAAEYVSRKFMSLFGGIIDLLGEATDKAFPMLKKEVEGVTAAQEEQNEEISDAIKMYRKAMGATEEAADAQGDLADATGEASDAVSSAEERQAQFASQADATTKKIRKQEEALVKVVARWNQLGAMVSTHGETVRQAGWLTMKDNEQLGLREHFQKIALQMGDRARKMELDAYKRTREMFGLLSKRQAQDHMRLKNLSSEARHKAVVAKEDAILKQAEETLQGQMEIGNVTNEERIKTVNKMTAAFHENVQASHAVLKADRARNQQEMIDEQKADKRAARRGRRKKKEPEAKPPVFFDPAEIDHEMTILRMKQGVAHAQEDITRASLRSQIIREQLHFDEMQQIGAAIAKYDDHAFAVEKIRAQFRLLNKIELEEYGRALDDIRMDEHRAQMDRMTESIQGMNAAFRESAGVMGSMSPPMAGAHAAMGQLATVSSMATIQIEKNNAAAKQHAKAAGASQEELAQVTGDNSKIMAGSIAAGLGAMGPAVAGFIDDQQKQAGVMALFEAAMAVATWWKNPAESIAHGVAAAMFAGIAATGIGVSSSAAAGGRGVAAQPTAQSVPHGDRGGPRQIVINFTDGMVLGDAQSLARKINETIDHASGNGLPARGA